MSGLNGDAFFLVGDYIGGKLPFFVVHVGVPDGTHIPGFDKRCLGFKSSYPLRRFITCTALYFECEQVGDIQGSNERENCVCECRVSSQDCGLDSSPKPNAFPTVIPRNIDLHSPLSRLES